MSVVQYHYAYQVCDTVNHQAEVRYSGTDRTTISKKSIRSFINCVYYYANNKQTKHTVRFFIDKASHDLMSWLDTVISDNIYSNIILEQEQLVKGGITESIKQCYLWLQDKGKDFVYQIQDDYLFEFDCLEQMTDVFNQIKLETGSECVISPFNDSYLWLGAYRNAATPRAVIVGKKQYWIQFYDTSCSFFTSHKQFSQHWDLYHIFFTILRNLKKGDKDLENKSLNYMFTQRAVLGLVPITSLALHIQSELEKDPHIDWKARWDTVII